MTSRTVTILRHVHVVAQLDPDARVVLRDELKQLSNCLVDLYARVCMRVRVHVHVHVRVRVRA